MKSRFRSRKQFVRVLSVAAATLVVGVPVLFWWLVLNRDAEMYDLGQALAERVVITSDDDAADQACEDLYLTQKAADTAGSEVFVGVDWDSSVGRKSFVEGCVDALDEAR